MNVQLLHVSDFVCCAGTFPTFIHSFIHAASRYSYSSKINK